MDLEEETQELIGVVGSAIRVSPVACFEGLPADYAQTTDAYVLGVVADTRTRLQEIIELTGRDPLFVARVRTMCID